MLTTEIVIKKLNNIYPSDKWVVEKDKHTIQRLWIKYKIDNTKHLHAFGYVCKNITQLNIKRSIMLTLKKLNKIRIKCSLKRKY